jgi:hypothetical protein
MYWENHSIKWRDYLGAEPIVRAQRRRRVITLALVLAASYLGLRTNALAVLREAAQTATTTVLRHVQSLVASIRAKDPTCRAS